MGKRECYPVSLFSKQGKELSLASSQHALVIFDHFKGQCTDSILKLLNESNDPLVIVPANCTDRHQPLDISVNKSAKEYLNEHAQYKRGVAGTENMAH